MTEAALITEDYRRMQAKLHRSPSYGVASVEYAPLVAQMLQASNTAQRSPHPEAQRVVAAEVS